ncbi:MAG: hydrogenase maturation nickel metallochaperone HypA [Bacteroidales bacterium]|nr:hydrogenase maturation nickel metallochaperone HypA [Bacteroidales bacterium]
MHELSIAVNIVEIAEASALKEGAHNISEITIDVGSQSGVVIEALNMALESAIKDTMLESAKININIIEAAARCLECGARYSPDDLFTPCPRCNSFQTEITQGKDLKVKSLTIE